MLPYIMLDFYDLKTLVDFLFRIRFRSCENSMKITDVKDNYFSLTVHHTHHLSTEWFGAEGTLLRNGTLLEQWQERTQRQ